MKKNIMILILFHLSKIVAQDHKISIQNSFAYSQFVTNMFGDYDNSLIGVTYVYSNIYVDLGIESLIFFDVAKIIYDDQKKEYRTLGNQYELNFAQVSTGLNFPFLKYFTFQSGVSVGYLLNKLIKKNPRIDSQTGFIDGIQFNPNEIMVVNPNQVSSEKNIESVRFSLFQRVSLSYPIWKNLSISTHIELINLITKLTTDENTLYFDSNFVKDNDVLKYGFGLAYSF